MACGNSNCDGEYITHRNGARLKCTVCALPPHTEQTKENPLPGSTDTGKKKK